MHEIPGSVKAEFQSWNNDKGIDLGSWVGCEGRFALAVGYGAVFCPEFVVFEDYIFWGLRPIRRRREKSGDSKPRKARRRNPSSGW